MMRLLVFANLLTFFSFSVDEDALSRSFHQTIDIDDVKNIYANYEASEDIEMMTWEGNMIMVQVDVVVYNTSAAVFNYFEKSGRYETLTSLEGGELILAPKKRKQKSVMSKGLKKEANEEISVKIFVPSTFKEVERNKWKLDEAF